MTVGTLPIATLNVRSLGQSIQGIRKRCEIRDFFRKAEPQLDMLLFQEHHMSLDDCLQLTHQLQFKGGASFWNNALYSAVGDKFTAGTGISISRLLATKVLDSGVLVEGRAQFLILDINGSHIGILNIYGPNDTGRRAQFWGILADIDYPEADWILCGDFNMTELGEDRTRTEVKVFTLKTWVHANKVHGQDFY